MSAIRLSCWYAPADSAARLLFCVRREELELFCEALSSMHAAHTGGAKLTDNDTDAFIRMEMEPNGHLAVIGQVGGTDNDHFTKFRFRTDQTAIPGFVYQIRSLLTMGYA